MKQKHNRVLMFEYAAGQKIEDYLYQKATGIYYFVCLISLLNMG